MLKIRDEIDLKELEKFNFTYYENPKYRKYKIYEKGSLFHKYICINVETRILEIYADNSDTIDEDTLYDLIKADLVEEVSNE